MYPYILLALASLLFVACVVFAYEMGKRVGTYETQRNYRFSNYKITTESRK
jgi:cbb3-type cytochrome oxidase subunit 3